MLICFELEVKPAEVQPWSIAGMPVPHLLGRACSKVCKSPNFSVQWVPPPSDASRFGSHEDKSSTKAARSGGASSESLRSETPMSTAGIGSIGRGLGLLVSSLLPHRVSRCPGLCIRKVLVRQRRQFSSRECSLYSTIVYGLHSQLLHKPPTTCDHEMCDAARISFGV